MFLCNEKLTLIQQIRTEDGESFICIPVIGGSWCGKTAIHQTEKGVAPRSTYESRIPVKSIPANITFHQGDYIVRGEVEQISKVPGDFAEMEYMKITAVKDNRRGIQRLWHWQVEGA